MPGAEKAQVERVMQLADRVSVNLEAPNTERLARLAPHKQFLEELLRPLKWIDEIRRSQPSPKAGMVAGHQQPRSSLWADPTKPIWSCLQLPPG